MLEMRTQMKKTINHKYIFFLTTFLIAIEQGIKLVINANYLENNDKILEGILYFNPMFNRDYSWFNSMLKLGIGKWFHIAFVGVVLLGIVLFYFFMNKDKKTSKLVDTMFSFIVGGAFCSFVDKVFWDGSLDYILVKGYFTFDLKDVYINVFIGLFILLLLLNYNHIKDVDENKLIKDYFSYVKGLFKREKKEVE